MNAYELFQEVRDNIGEASAAHWTDAAILRKLNAGQRKAYNLISQTPGDWFIKKDTLTPSSGEVTLPTDCAKPVYMESTSEKCEVPINLTVREKRVDQPIGFGLETGLNQAYLIEGKIVINNTSFTGNVDLWYERRIPDLHFGTAAAGGAQSLTLEDSKQHSYLDNYYNGMTIEVVDGTGKGRDTITDYTASTRVCVVSGTYSTDSVYGLVSVLPREACDFIMLHATVALLSKPGSNADPSYLSYWGKQLKEEVVALEYWCTRRLKNSLHTRRIGD